MTQDEIKILIKRKGASLRDIAEAADVAPSTVCRVVSGDIKSRRIASMISLFLGKSLDDLWPGHYPANYSRRSAQNVRNELRAAVMSVDSARAA